MLIASSCGLSPTEKMIHVLHQEDFGIQIFQSNVKNVADSITLLSSEEKVSLFKDGLENVELDGPGAGNSKAVWF